MQSPFGLISRLVVLSAMPCPTKAESGVMHRAALRPIFWGESMNRDWRRHFVVLPGFIANQEDAIVSNFCGPQALGPVDPSPIRTQAYIFKRTNGAPGNLRRKRICPIQLPRDNYIRRGDIARGIGRLDEDMVVSTAERSHGNVGVEISIPDDSRGNTKSQRSRGAAVH